MRTVGIGAEKKTSCDLEELKKENKSLKTANTKLTKKLEELETEKEELTKKLEESVNPE